MRDHYTPMSHQQRQRELYGFPQDRDPGPTPPHELDAGVAADVARIYFDAAHEAARRGYERQQREDYEAAAMYDDLAASHLRSYREQRPDGYTLD